MTDPRLKAVVDVMVQRLVDKGLLIEGGWVGYDKFVINPQASELQRRELRFAFFAGAQHLYSSMMAVLDPSTSDITDSDMRRMELIDKELKNFAQEIEDRIQQQQEPRQ